MRSICIKHVEIKLIFKATKGFAWPLIRAAALQGVLEEVENTGNSRASARKSVLALLSETEANSCDRSMVVERAGYLPGSSRDDILRSGSAPSSSSPSIRRRRAKQAESRQYERLACFKSQTSL